MDSYLFRPSSYLYSLGNKSKQFFSNIFDYLRSFFLGLFTFPLYKKTFNVLDKNVDEAIAEYKSTALGVEGEKVVSQWIKELLQKETYKFLFNVTIPGCNFDIDALGIGPKGILLFEIKNFSIHVYFEKDKYYEIIDGRKILLPEKDDPRYKIGFYAKILNEFLRKNGIEQVSIHKTVVFAKKDTISFEGKPGIYIASSKESLKAYLDYLKKDEACTPEYCEKIVSALKDAS